MERVDVSKLTFKKYQGRYGCSFLYPADWEVAVDNPMAPSGGREILHPTNPEICISYIDIWEDQFGYIEELGEDEERIYKKVGCRILVHTYHKRTYPSCSRGIEFSKMVFSARSRRDKSIKKMAVRICTKLDNDIYYGLQMECPEQSYEANKELMQYVISSIAFDCAKIYNEY